MTTPAIGEDKLGADGDTVYAAIMKVHAGLKEAQSHAMNARLVLLMANEIGNKGRLIQLLEYARSVDEI